MKTDSMEAELFHADRRTGMKKLAIVTTVLWTRLQIQNFSELKTQTSRL
jgi:hypothetical protein